MPPEFYLIIFLMVAMLIYVYFYGERAQSRRSKRKMTDRGSTTDPADV
jgi:preprotein translocase subunit YajC